MPKPVRIIPATDLGNVEVAKVANLYLLTDPRGDIRPDSRGLGLYDLDTRILSSSIVRLNRQQLTLLRGPRRDGDAETIQLTNPEMRRLGDKRTADQSLARQELSVTRTRKIDGVLHEEVAVESFSARTESILVELGLGVDMADIFEVRGYDRDGRGTLEPPTIDGALVKFAYDGLDGRRRVTTVHVNGASIDPVVDDEAWPGSMVVASWRARLRPGHRMAVDWTVSWTVDRRSSRVRSRPSGPPSFPVARIRSDNKLLDGTLARSEADLAMLRNVGPDPGESYLAAGIPWFATLFGRDSIIAALEMLPFSPTLATATLRVLARLQATSDDPAHDAEPGKIVHEIRSGEMAATGEVPYAAYYGSIDATPLWLILLGETHAWTGDDSLLDALWPNALAALAWIDGPADIDGDGFVEYWRRSEHGLANQGWKDSGDSIRHVDGRLAEGPIALAEVQGYVYAARRAMARLASHRGESELAARLDSDADSIQGRFDDAFWVPRARFYATALDGDKGPVASIGSNVGQALWTGIVPGDRAARVAERLTEPDMFSGWGIRTYAAGQPGYNPVGYHTGSIWPHDNAIIAAGFKWTGSPDDANLLAGRLIESAQWFPEFRLPELFCGFDRRTVGAPVAYPVACSPQAWSAASPYFLLSTMLGLRADACARRLELVHPKLPDWLGQLKVTGLPVGAGSIDLLVHRWRGRTSAEVLDSRGDVDVVIHA